MTNTAKSNKSHFQNIFSSTSKLPNDLLDLQQPTFHPSVLSMSTASQVASTWGGKHQ